MKIAVLMAALLAATLSARGAAPSSVAGFIVSFSESSPVNLFNATRTELLLNPNEITTGILLLETQEGQVGSTLSGILANVSFPSAGTWSYRIIDPDTAELVVNGRTLRLLFEGSGLQGRITNLRSLLVPRFSFRTHVVAAPVVNCSSRAYVAPGRSVSVGFVLSQGDRRVLVRAVGPGLRTFGLSEVLDQPVLSVRRPNKAPEPTRDQSRLVPRTSRTNSRRGLLKGSGLRHDPVRLPLPT